MAKENVKRLYQNKFDSDYYLHVYNGKIFSWHSYYMKKLHSVFSTTQEINTKRCIHIGPTLYTAISASQSAHSITLCEFSAANRKHFKDWKNNKPDIFSWTEHFKFVAALEDFDNIEDGSQETRLETRLRNKIDEVLHCDVTLDYPLDSRREQYDVLITSVTLEAATENADDYGRAVKNISNLLKPGGQLLVNGLLNGSWYTVGGTKYPFATLNKDLVHDSLISAGFKVELYSETDTPDIFETDCRGCFFCHCTKLE